MPSIQIVKRSDVSFGTALHYATSWSYGRTSLCGQPMRAYARDREIGLKDVCRSCVRILASQVEKAHAEALKMNTPQATAAPGAKLSPAMTKGLIHFHRTGDWADVRTGTVVALLDRGLVTHSRQGSSPDVITDWGIDALVRLGELSYVSDECRHTVPVGGCADCEHAEKLEQAKSNLDVADFDEEAAYAQAERENEPCPPVCEHGATAEEACTGESCVTRADNAFLLGTEYNFVIDCEQEFANGLRTQGVSLSQSREAVRALRRGGTSVTLVWRLGDELLAEYRRLLRKHGASSIPMVVRDKTAAHAG